MIVLALFWSELKKEIIIAFNYKFQWAGDFLSLAVFYLFLAKLSTKIEFQTLSYSLWFYSVLIIGDISGKISSEMRLGTFEQTYLSVFSLLTLFMVKVFVSIFRCIILMIVFLVFLTVVDFNCFNIFTFKCFVTIFAGLCITPGLFGFSLLVGGITLLIKDAGWISNILNNSMLFLSGIFLNIGSFPGWVQKIALLIPTTRAIQLINYNNQLLSEWGITFVLSFVYFAIGGIFFYFCDKRARVMGIVGYH